MTGTHGLPLMHPTAGRAARGRHPASAREHLRQADLRQVTATATSPLAPGLLLHDRDTTRRLIGRTQAAGLGHGAASNTHAAVPPTARPPQHDQPPLTARSLPAGRARCAVHRPARAHQPTTLGQLVIAWHQTSQAVLVRRRLTAEEPGARYAAGVNNIVVSNRTSGRGPGRLGRAR